MRRLPLLSVACAMMLIPQGAADACTNVIISRGASADGSCMVSYAADSHLLFGELYFHKAADWKAGTMLPIIEWDTYKPLGSIAQVAHTYQTVGNMNEHQLIIAETTFGGRSELVDKKGGIDYGSNGMPDYSANQMHLDAVNKGAEHGAVSAMPEIPGLVLWKEGHTGIYIGGGYAIEAMSTSKGVGKTKVEGRGWQEWYKLPYISYGEG